MADQIRKEIEKHTEAAGGGDSRDSQGDGVADAAAEAADAVTGAPDAPAPDTGGKARPNAPNATADKATGNKQELSQPGTNREAVPGGLEGSIMENEDTDDASGSGGTGRRGTK